MTEQSNQFASFLGININDYKHPAIKNEKVESKKPLKSTTLRNVHEQVNQITKENMFELHSSSQLSYDDEETSKITQLYEQLSNDEHPFTFYFKLQDVLKSRELRA